MLHVSYMRRICVVSRLRVWIVPNSVGGQCRSQIARDSESAGDMSGVLRNNRVPTLSRW